ncbi:MAG: hypothetical protein EOO68_20660, partial [Moraxellaceae bacterium]
MLCKKNGGYIAIIIGMLVAFYVANQSHAETFEGLAIKTEGKGDAVIFIPGLNSGADVFSEACAAIKSTHQCHMVQLPGFAGLPPIALDNKDFLISMRDRIEHYVDTKKLKNITLIGHSLGGT